MTVEYFVAGNGIIDDSGSSRMADRIAQDEASRGYPEAEKFAEPWGMLIVAFRDRERAVSRLFGVAWALMVLQRVDKAESHGRQGVQRHSSKWGRVRGPLTG